MTFYSLKLRDWLTIPDDRFPSNPQLGQVVELTCMDLLVEFRGLWILMEVKNKKGKNKLTEDQIIFFKKVKAPAFIIRDIEEACAAVQTAWRRTLKSVVDG